MGSACFKYVGVKHEDCTAPSNTRKGTSCRTEEAEDDKTQMQFKTKEESAATGIYGDNSASYSSLFVDF